MTPFWQSVRELAALRKHIPEERRALSAVRCLFKRWKDEHERGVPDCYNVPRNVIQVHDPGDEDRR